MRTHNRQQMADVMPDADAVSPVIESTLSVSIMGRGRRGWLLLPSIHHGGPQGPPLPFTHCSLTVVVVDKGGTSDCVTVLCRGFTHMMFKLILIIILCRSKPR